MKEHPRNEGTSQLDFALLMLMPVSILVLLGLITYMAMDSLTLVGG